ncbi:MAG: 2-oxoacid:ferredoxin oxidoreductase subunit beta [Calditrichaceae bacterium]
MEKLTKRDFESDQEPRWCPGCGDFAILAQIKKILPELNIPKENIVFVSGIGCSSRFPYYLETYGFHGIHGRAPAIASGIKIANPDLKVFIVTGDGDGLSIGGNHLIHLFRRNVDVTVLLFNNQIYGLTKGQYSPTSEKGKITKSSPYGTLERPFNPVKLALSAGATFVARSIDREQKHLNEILTHAANHKGASFVEIYQNCNIFNDGAFERLTNPDNILYMEEDKNYIFGTESDKLINIKNNQIEIVNIKNPFKTNNYIKHKYDYANPAIEVLLAGMSERPDLPTPVGIFRSAKNDCYDELVQRQIDYVKAEKGEGNLEKLFFSGDTWTVK